MTDFFTRCCRKLSLLWLLAFLCVAFNASADSIEVKRAELEHVGSSYRLNADFSIEFPSEIEKALSKGVPLAFLIEFQLVSPRKYWFDDEIVTTSKSVMLHFHALSRQYLITDGQHQKSFATLEEAKEELSHARDWEVLDQSRLQEGEEYEAVVRYRLDPSRLPKALQVEVLGSEKWTMVSERYRWRPALMGVNAP